MTETKCRWCGKTLYWSLMHDGMDNYPFFCSKRCEVEAENAQYAPPPQAAPLRRCDYCGNELAERYWTDGRAQDCAFCCRRCAADYVERFCAAETTIPPAPSTPPAPPQPPTPQPAANPPQSTSSKSASSGGDALTAKDAALLDELLHL